MMKISELINSRRRDSLFLNLLVLSFLAFFYACSSSGSNPEPGSAQLVATLNTTRSVDYFLNDAGQIAWVDTLDDGWALYFYSDGTQNRLAAGSDLIGNLQLNNGGDLIWLEIGGDEYRLYLADKNGVTRLSEEGEMPTYPQINDQGQIVFGLAYAPPRNWEIVTIVEGQRHNIPTDDRNAMDPEINNNGQIMWYGVEGDDETHIFLHDGGTTRRISQENVNYWKYGFRQINDQGQIAWIGKPGMKLNIYLFDGDQMVQLTDSVNNLHPIINNAGQVVWQGFDGNDWEIYRYSEGRISAVTDNPVDDKHPMINDQGQIVWQGFDGNDYEIFLHSDGSIYQATSNEIDDTLPQINNNNQMAWTEKNAASTGQRLYTAPVGLGSVIAERELSAYTSLPPLRQPQPTVDKAQSLPTAPQARSPYKMTGEEDDDWLFRFVVMGDSRNGGGWVPTSPKYSSKFLNGMAETIGQLKPLPLSVVFLGDMATYPFAPWPDLPDLPDFKVGTFYIPKWKKAFVSKLPKSVAFRPVIGNHETYLFYSTSKHHGTPNYAQFKFAIEGLDINQQPSANGPCYDYVFYMGSEKEPDMLFAFYVFDNFCTTGDHEQDWTISGLRNDQLEAFKNMDDFWKKLKKPTVTAKFAFGHAPMITNLKGSDIGPNMNNLLGELLTRRYSGYYAGHRHLYGRWTHPSQFDQQPPGWYLPEVVAGANGVDSFESPSLNTPDKGFQKGIAQYNFVIVDVWVDSAINTVYYVPNSKYDEAYSLKDWKCFDKFQVYFDDGRIVNLQCPDS